MTTHYTCTERFCLKVAPNQVRGIGYTTASWLALCCRKHADTSSLACRLLSRCLHSQSSVISPTSYDRPKPTDSVVSACQRRVISFSRSKRRGQLSDWPMPRVGQHVATWWWAVVRDKTTRPKHERDVRLRYLMVSALGLNRF